MPSFEAETCWQLVRGAASGGTAEREELARRYLPTVRAYLRSRWRGSALASEVEDVVQEVFVALFKKGGALEQAEPGHDSGFRALLFGVTRNFALHTERTRARRIRRVGDGPFEPDRTPADEPTLTRIFDSAYAKTVMRRARFVMAERNGESGRRRVELLRLRFEEGLPIRDIAARWQVDPDALHREYAKARRDFRDALAATVAETERCSAERIERECEQLLELLREGRDR